MKKKYRVASKKIAERNHFKKRLQQRYGLSLCKKSYETVIECIQKQYPDDFPITVNGHNLRASIVLRGSQTNRLTYVELKLHGINDGQIPCVYDKQRKELVTCHPDLFTSHKYVNKYNEAEFD